MKMVASEAGGKCKRHPEKEELPGVCSACLRERLSQLYGCKSQNSNTSTVDMVMMMGVSVGVGVAVAVGVSSCSSSLSSSSPPYSSASSSTRITPNRRGAGGVGTGNHHRRASEVTTKISMVMGGGLKKSRSLAVVPSAGADGKIKKGADGKIKKGGFWSIITGLRKSPPKSSRSYGLWAEEE